MPDITMCKGEKLVGLGPVPSTRGVKTRACPQRDTCYRFTAKPSEFRQSYFMHAPFTEDGCEHYMEVWK